MVDVIIAGGGIAGASLAILLARQGLQVKLFDRARFPREKPCGEGLMPAGVEALGRLGVEIHGAPFRGVRYWHGDESVEGRFPRRAHGIAVRRKHLDDALLQAAARQPGVEVLTECRVAAPLIQNGTIHGVVTSGGVERGRLTVGADGASSQLRHKLGWSAPAKAGRFGVRVHYRISTPLENWVDVYLQAGREIYVTPLPECELLVATLSESKAPAPLPGRLAGILRNAEPMDQPLGAAPLNVRALRRHAEGFVLIGDAAGNCDPITGGGMTQALLSSELLASHLAKRFPPTQHDLAVFDVQRERMLRDYRRLTSLILALADRPRLIPPALEILRAWPSLFSHLIGVAGGVRPLFAWPGSKAA